MQMNLICSFIFLSVLPAELGGEDRDVGQRRPRQRLESISVRHGMIVDCISFSYRDRDGKLHTAGPWGGTGGLSEETITLGPDEYVTEVAGAVGPFGELTHTVAWLKFVTNRATYGPFGHGDGTAFNIPVLNNGSIVAMFARAGQYLDAIGFYVLPF